MKSIAIATNTDKLSGTLAHSPGHCKYFCIIKENEKPFFINNHAYQSKLAFGKIAFEKLQEHNIKIIIANFFGPKFSQLANNSSVRLLSPPPEINKLNSIIHFLNLNIMPNLNGKGPAGEGPKTGKSQGKCNPNSKELNENTTDEKQAPTTPSRQGRRLGKGRGQGEGMGKGRKNRNV